MADNSFDVVSKVDIPEVHNAIQQALKEIVNRYDLKNSRSSIEFREKDNLLILASANEFQLKAVIDILESKLVKRQVPLRNFEYGEVQPAAGQTVRMEVKLQQGLATEKAKEIVKAIKDSKIKVSFSIMGDYVRVSSKSRDLLQQVIQLLKSGDFGVDLQFTNYR